MHKLAALTLVVSLAAPRSARDDLPMRSPDEVGMSADRLAALDRVVTRGIEAGGYPGAAVVVGRRGAIVWQRGYGHLAWQPQSADVDPRRTVYDLASLTKVVATATAIMVLFDEGKVDLDAPVARYVPGFVGGGKEQVTVRHLLTHCSGLPAGRDIWRVSRNPKRARRAVLKTPLDHLPERRCIYSDLGADVLGYVAEAASGQRLDAFLARRVYGPLGMRSTTFRPATALRPRVAPTGIRRGRTVRGEVHDENAYALGGVAGHAGLFASAADLAVFAQMMLDGGQYNGVRIVSDSAVRLFTTRVAGSRALGWDTCAGGGSCGHYLGERAYGHTGFTGTSMWIDPDREMFVILLTNWVHPTLSGRAAPVAILADVRADVADVAATSVLDLPDGTVVPPAVLRADLAIGWRR